MRLPSTVEPNAANGVPLSPLSLLDRSIIVYADKLAVAHGERRWTYREFGDLVRRMAGALEERGIGPGDTVSIVSANRPEMLAAHFAVPMLGAVLNTINTRLDVETVRYILDHCSAQVVIADKALSRKRAATSRSTACVRKARRGRVRLSIFWTARGRSPTGRSWTG